MNRSIVDVRAWSELWGFKQVDANVRLPIVPSSYVCESTAALARAITP